MKALKTISLILVSMLIFSLCVSCDSGVSPEFKETMDKYEDFFDDYVEFMEKYNKASDKTSMMTEYTSMLSQYSSMMSSMNSVKADELTEADLAYYNKVVERINKKLESIN